jgi:hypothetical protein
LSKEPLWSCYSDKMDEDGKMTVVWTLDPTWRRKDFADEARSSARLDWEISLGRGMKGIDSDLLKYKSPPLPRVYQPGLRATLFQRWIRDRNWWLSKLAISCYIRVGQ